MIQEPRVDCNPEEQRPTQAQTQRQYEPTDSELFYRVQPREHSETVIVAFDGTEREKTDSHENTGIATNG
jgi:hypothetical protein